MPTILAGLDAELVGKLAAIRAGMEALNQVLYTSLDPDDINDCLEQHHAALLTIRRLVPNHVLDAVGQPLPTYADTPDTDQ